MTREDGIRWKKEIEHWLDGGNLWRFDKEYKVWRKHFKGINFTSSDKTYYVIEDQHFEARKANALDKEVQVSFNGSNNWMSVNGEPNWNNFESYRPKPEPVEVWQWVARDTTSNTHEPIYKLTRSFYKNKQEAIDARTSSRWSIQYPFEPSKRLRYD